MDEHTEREFLSRARSQVLEYLQHSGVTHGGVPENPDWHLSPKISVWPVMSSRGAWPGWFAIAGDLPTDYVSSDIARDARAALRHFSRLWREVAECMARGEAHPECRIGSPESWPNLHDLLRRRAELLGEFAEDDGLWMEGE
jgi:hypothetical protein